MKFGRLALLAALTLPSACGGPGEIAARLPAEESAWVELSPRAARIEGRRIEPACSGAPGADESFRFWAKRGAADKLVVYFDGGGACWSDETCSRPWLDGAADDEKGYYTAELMRRGDPRARAGVFDLDDERNPLRDWSFVVVPYCTGDVHSGSHAQRYADPETGEAFVLRHQGADNFRLILEWMKDNFDAPESLLVTGSSAGAYGASFHYDRIRKAFPKGRGYMLGDAGQGVTTEDFAQRSAARWGYELSPSVFGRNARLAPDVDVVARLAAHYPGDRFAQYTTAQDDVQTSFFALMGVEDPCAAWMSTMARQLDARSQTANFRAYLAPGESHTILGSPAFYEDPGVGAPMSDWLAVMLEAADDGWTNRICADCLSPSAACPY